MNKSNHRSPFAIVGRLIVLVKPMLPVMLAAIVMGVAGHFCATFITILGGFGILRALGLASPVRTVGTAFACILVFALLRGVLRYAEQASNHYIAFKLLALIRDKVFGALRRLTPAKLEGRDRGDLISLITADIEALEVFYAHTISPICIAFICVIGMTGFVGSWHILPALVLLAGYLLVGVALPVWSAKRGDKVAREYREKLEQKVHDLLEDSQIDDNRIAAEVVLFSDKICNDEETVRLRSHIHGMRKILDENEGVGRKMDFMAQEMNREANTILSKSNDLIVSNAAIDLKTEIEKIREQIQNIE